MEFGKCRTLFLLDTENDQSAEQRASADAGGCAAVAAELGAVRRHAENVRVRVSGHSRFGPHQHRASVPCWPAPAGIVPQERPSLPSQRFPVNGSSSPLNSISAQAYRPVMSRLINQLSPNPRLQRTRSAPLRSPLSRKPFGAAVKFRAGGRLVGERGAAQHRPCVHVPISASTAGPWAQRTPWHLEGLTAKAYRATREIQPI